MTNEEKQLLLQDLSARLPYGPLCNIQTRFVFEDGTIRRGSYDKILDLETVTEIDSWYKNNELEKLKPYLRPLDSMTDEELKCFQAFHCVDELHPRFFQQMCNLDNETAMFEWLNKKMFDYRGLIPMGLALPAKEGMYNN